jgi:UDP-galactopyranose mutase
MVFDYLIAGSGLTGSVLARILTDAGKRVLVVDRRGHGGGNVHDAVREFGIRVHTYGPHYFRCNSNRIWDFVNRFTAFFPYEARIQSVVDGRLEHWPVNEDTIRRLAPPGWKPAVGPVKTFEDACLTKMPREVYAKFVEPYTEKQWGHPPNLLDPELGKRIRVNAAGEQRLTPNHRYQGLPVDGYARFMERMLEGIDVRLKVDYIREKAALPKANNVIFTGPIDEYFGYHLGRLRYRGQRRKHEAHPEETFAQPCAQVNYPGREHAGIIRTMEWKHLMPDASILQRKGTILTTESPFAAEEPDSCEYPFPDAVNKGLYDKYREEARAHPETVFCGRLGEYRYLDMDQAIGRAMLLSSKLLANVSGPALEQRDSDPNEEI